MSNDLGLNLKLNIHALATTMDEQAKEFGVTDAEHSNLIQTGEGVLKQFHDSPEYPVMVFYVLREYADDGTLVVTVDCMEFDENGDVRE